MFVKLGRAAAAARVLLAFSFAGLVTGCGGGRIEEGTVSIRGAVTVDGKPVADASVAFIGKEGARLATATTDNSGKFTVRAALGKNVVTVAKASATPAAPASDEPMGMPSRGEYEKVVAQQLAKSEIPAKYGDPKTSGLSIEAKEGMQEIELALSSK